MRSSSVVLLVHSRTLCHPPHDFISVALLSNHVFKMCNHDNAKYTFDRKITDQPPQRLHRMVPLSCMKFQVSINTAEYTIYMLVCISAFINTRPDVFSVWYCTYLH